MVQLRCALLVFVLSGMPASAVLCDLVLCSPAPAAGDGCHGHGTTISTARAVASADRCSHLAFTAPSLAAAPRESGARVAPVAAAEGPRFPERVYAPVNHVLAAKAPHRTDTPERFLPLRI
jgi:hypothetical protein